MASNRWKKKGIERFTGLKKGEINLPCGKSRKEQRRGGADSPSGFQLANGLGRKKERGKGTLRSGLHLSVTGGAGPVCQREREGDGLWCPMGLHARGEKGVGLSWAT